MGMTKDRRRLERLGWERALIYKTLVLHADDEKNREGSTIPLRSDLVGDLREWLAEKAVLLQEAARATQTVRFAPEAGIPKRDERGRTVDAHAMRTTFGTLLSRGGVAPRTAQAAMRHSTIDLTMNTYTDPRLLDVAGAVEALPALPLMGGTQVDRTAVKTTGTEDFRASPLAPTLAPTSDKLRILQSTLARQSRPAALAFLPDALAASGCGVNENSPLTTAVNGLREKRETGVEPATSSLGS